MRHTGLPCGSSGGSSAASAARAAAAAAVAVGAHAAATMRLASAPRPPSLPQPPAPSLHAAASTVERPSAAARAPRRYATRSASSACHGSPAASSTGTLRSAIRATRPGMSASTLSPLKWKIPQRSTKSSTKGSAGGRLRGGCRLPPAGRCPPAPAAPEPPLPPPLLRSSNATAPAACPPAHNSAATTATGAPAVSASAASCSARPPHSTPPGAPSSSLATSSASCGSAHSRANTPTASRSWPARMKNAAASCGRCCPSSANAFLAATAAPLEEPKSRPRNSAMRVLPAWRKSDCSSEVRRSATYSSMHSCASRWRANTERASDSATDLAASTSSSQRPAPRRRSCGHDTAPPPAAAATEAALRATERKPAPGVPAAGDMRSSSPSRSGTCGAAAAGSDD
eukprot:365831-Chlamydomonas_euryale.AAC.14